MPRTVSQPCDVRVAFFLAVSMELARFFAWAVNRPLFNFIDRFWRDKFISHFPHLSDCLSTTFRNLLLFPRPLPPFIDPFQKTASF